jgi:hypothetical protein
MTSSAEQGADQEVIFRSKAGPKDAARVAAAPQAASTAIIEVRRSHRRTIPFARTIQSYHENKRRKLDIPG